ncbi:VanZ family protein [Nocardioides abyssi]|uniref:VanZ family protein n=1 Tax=Nocardioides abyssi TaxID=3058370 RepID=A0ABT8EX75_9ACTN|nr:VanZ family protein [Nocardioides abyssi]MDN4162471.1 VanZ family protein [Nocardioides abyssi]
MTIPTARAARIALSGYLLFLAWGFFAPVPDAPSGLVAWMSSTGDALGLPAALTEGSRMEFVANVLIVAPVPVLAAWSEVPLVRAWSWRDWTSVMFVGSATVELVQAFLLPARSATYVDIVANTAGGLLGAAAVHVVERLSVRDGRAFDRPGGRWLR